VAVEVDLDTLVEGELESRGDERAEVGLALLGAGGMRKSTVTFSSPRRQRCTVGLPASLV
jgi:hypothetical protein